MLVTYLRSSALGTLEFCEQKYFFVYVLGKQDKTNKAAIKGSAVHHVMELLGMKVLAERNNEQTVQSEAGEFAVSELDDIPRIAEASYFYYKNKEGEGLNWTDKDRRDVIEWSNKALAFNGGELDPRNQDIEMLEEFFDFEVKEDWAKYEYEVDGELVSGYLRLRGTVDCIVAVDREAKLFHIIDYKTGRRMNWATGEVKEHMDFYKDKQLLFYYYALRNKYPDYEFEVSIYYINDHKIDGKLVEGGLFTVIFDDDYYKEAEAMIKRRFEYIRSVELPRQLSSTNAHWKCQRLCEFSKIDEKSGKTYCQTIHDQIKDFGISAVTDRHADMDMQNQYKGGGKYDVAVKESK